MEPVVTFPPELLSPEALLHLAGEQSLQRGLKYVGEGRVSALEVAGNQARGTVLGEATYSVELEANDGKLRHSCNCPFGLRGAFCKHGVAVALSVAAGGAPPTSRDRDNRVRVELDEEATDAREEPGDRQQGEAGPFDTRDELRTWLAEESVEHLARVAATVLTRNLDPVKERPFIDALARHRLFDVASHEGVRLTGYGVTHLKGRERVPVWAWRFLRGEVERCERAQEMLSVTLRAPADANVLPLHEALLRLRTAFSPKLRPRLVDERVLERLRYASLLPGFAYVEDFRCEAKSGFGFVTPDVKLKLDRDGASVQCACGESMCPHALLAVDAALHWLKVTRKSEARETALDEMLRPPWERSLMAIEKVLQEATGAQSVQLTWRISVSDFGVMVVPYLHRPNKKGVMSGGARISPRLLLDSHRHALSEADVRLASLIQDTNDYAQREVLRELAGHPRLFLDEEPDRPVKVEREWVGIVAQERGGTVVLSLGVDGTPLPAAMLRKLNRGGPEDAHFLWDAGSRFLTVLEMAKETQALMHVLETHGNEFPPESHGALLEKLSLASARVPVAMPRSVMGESVASENAPVLRLELQPGGQVRVELRIRPLPESLAHPAGLGPKDVHVRRGSKALHAVRDFAKEERLAADLERDLGFTPEERGPEPFLFEVEDAQRALALLERAKTLTPAPGIEWRGDALRMVGSAAAPSLRVVLDKRRDWFGMLGGLSVHGERVELAVLLDASRRKQRFVQAGPNAYIEIEDKLRAHLTRLADHTYRSTHGLEVGPSAVEAIAELENSGVEVTADDVWQSLAQKIFAAQALKPRVPSTLKTTLRDYQLSGYEWLSRLASWGAGGVLADDMGLGKTVQALTVLLSRAKLGPALVLAPTSVGFNWVDEAAKFAPALRVFSYSELEDRGAALERLGPKDVLVLSYGLLTRDVERLAQKHFATIVFDEAQALKNASTQRVRAARQLNGDFRFALSGTPLENHLGELWSIFRIVFPGLLGSWEAFRTRFALPIEKKTDPTAAPALGRVLGPFLLRRTKSQVERELPPRTDIRVPVVLSSEEWTLYEDARLAALSDLETPRAKMRDNERRIEVLAALTRLRLLASHPKLYDPSSTLSSAKLERFGELVDELMQGGHRALVFSQFVSHLSLVREVLDERKIRYEYLDGSCSPKERARSVKAFQEGTAPLFLISLKAGGFGLNLTQADYVIHLDPWWNPAVEDQASDRAHRIGQTKPVTVYRLVAKGTIEEQILGLHADKRELVANILEGRDEAARLSTQELLSLLTATTPLSGMRTDGTRH